MKTNILHLGLVWLLSGWLLVTCSESQMTKKPEQNDWSKKRAAMVEKLRAYGIKDKRVLKAMSTVWRHKFIPAEYLGYSPPYGDHPCTIGYNQTISQPYIVAYMTEKMDIKPGEKVLEIGTGSGYQAAVIAELGAKLYTIEIIPELADHAQKALVSEGYDSVKVLTGDGYKGWPEHSPFDVIIVTCAPENIPQALVDQLKEGGRMILPVGTYFQRLVILLKKSGRIHKIDDLAVRFVPMVRDKK